MPKEPMEARELMEEEPRALAVISKLVQEEIVGEDDQRSLQ